MQQSGTAIILQQPVSAQIRASDNSTRMNKTAMMPQQESWQWHHNDILARCCIWQSGLNMHTACNQASWFHRRSACGSGKKGSIIKMKAACAAIRLRWRHNMKKSAMVPHQSWWWCRIDKSAMTPYSSNLARCGKEKANKQNKQCHNIQFGINATSSPV